MSTTLRGDAVRLVRDHAWEHLQSAGFCSRKLSRAFVLQSTIGWLHEPLAPVVTLGDRDAAYLRSVCLDTIEAWSENLAHELTGEGAAHALDDPEESQQYVQEIAGYLRDARRALHAVTPAA